MIDLLYAQGYTAALQDVIRVLEYIDEDMSKHKIRRNSKTYTNLIKCMLQNRKLLRDYPDSFIRCNNDVDGKFEPWIYDKSIIYKYYRCGHTPFKMGDYGVQDYKQVWELKDGCTKEDFEAEIRAKIAKINGK